MGIPRIRPLLVAAVISLVGLLAPAIASPTAGTASTAQAGAVGATLPAVTTSFEGQVDVLARDADGRLLLYRGNGRGGWISPAVQVGHGWGGRTAILGPGDFNGDGNVDVLARTPDGRLLLYRGNGRGGWISPAVQVGHGWGGMTAILGPGDFNGDGTTSSSVNCAVVACVALTFDDGPSAYTDRLISILDSTNTPATLFVVGSQVAARPATVRRARAAGLAVENHTYSHPQLTTLSYSEQLSQVTRTDDALAAAGVPRSTLLRPPYGSWNSTTRTLGKPLILWSVDPRDWEVRDAAAVRSRVVSNATAGSIVLLHDSHSTTVDAVPGIISDLRARGFTLVTVKTLVPTMQAGDVVYSRTNISRAGTATALSDQADVLRAPGGSDGSVLDEAPFVPEQ